MLETASDGGTPFNQKTLNRITTTCRITCRIGSNVNTGGVHCILKGNALCIAMQSIQVKIITH